MYMFYKAPIQGKIVRKKHPENSQLRDPKSLLRGIAALDFKLPPFPSLQGFS
jgi:hypothetical protein